MAYQDKLKPIATTTPSYAAKLKPINNDGFVETVAKDIARPFARLGVNLLSAGTGFIDPTRAKQIDKEGVNIPFLGQTKPVGMSGNFGQDIKDAVGVGIEAASVISPALKAPALFKSTIAGAIGAAAKTGAKAGAIGGAQYGLGRELQNPSSTPISTALSTLQGGAFGLAGGALLGGAFATPSAIASRAKSIANRNTAPAIVDRRLAELTKLTDNNAPVRKVVDKHLQRGINTNKILAQTDLLHGAVDNTGTLRTQNAIAELNSFIKPHEDVISANLLKEGVTLPVRSVQAYLRQAIENSGLQGAAYTRALKNVEDDLVGYVARANDTKIPLALIHAAKVDKYANINYLNPESKRADKAIARALKELVEQHTRSVDVKALNRELSQHFSVLDLLEKLDGRKVQGGKLGKYFAQTIGAIVGSHFGPLGSIIGAEAGGRVQGSVLSSKLRGKTGAGLTRSAAMDAAVASGKAPPLGLPAPRGGAKVQNNVAIPLRGPSTIEPAAQSINRGSLIQSQTPTPANTSNSISQSLPYSPAVTRLLALAEKPNTVNGVAKATKDNTTSSTKRSVSRPTTASKPSKADVTSTGNAPIVKEGVSAQRADTSGPFDGEQAPSKQMTEMAKFTKYRFSDFESDMSGNRLFHGTAADFDAFDMSKIGKIHQSDFGKGIYLTPDEGLAGAYAKSATGGESKGVVKEFYIDPAAKVKEYKIGETFQTADELAKEGYDAIFAYGNKLGSTKLEEVVVMNPKVLYTPNQLEQVWKQTNTAGSKTKPSSPSIPKELEPKRKLK